MNDKCKTCDYYLLCIVGELQSIFDDWKDDKCGKWSQVCNEHTYNSCDKITVGGFGTCGIKGCDNMAEHYIDF